MAYHGSEPLTYASETKLLPGTLVKVNLRGQHALGIVVRTVSQPKFNVKPIVVVSQFSPLPSQYLSLLNWMYAYYPAPLGAVVRQFTPPTEIFPKQLSESTSPKIRTVELPPLGSEQLHAIKAIEGPGTFVLHGITGSGKSRVYIELAKQAATSNKSSLILTPEIGLTAQLTESFRQVFGGAVYVIHSQLTSAERRNIYYLVLQQKDPCIVIGPRSALFSPLRRLGLIVLDEAHDNAYKNESAPHYQSGRVAAKLANLHGATLVLGSATPAIEDYYLAEAKKRPIVAMNKLAKESDTSLAIEMIDMRNTKLFTRSSLLSNAMLTHIGAAMKRNEQSLVFLNRRGTANVVLCSSCGWQSLCPNCDLTLTYHGDTHSLRCHVCGFCTELPTACPVCHRAEILFRSVGTKAIVDSLTKLFPTAHIQRFDTDTKKAERLEQNLDALVAGGADIIVGTQMVSKGLDLPRLSVVGIVNADSSLLIPDYTASEKTYQIISQVVGRVGRGHRAGTVIVQTYNPQNEILQAAVRSDWQAFYQVELAERKTYHFPPYVYLLKLHVLRATSPSAEKSAKGFADAIAKAHTSITIEGPAPSFHPRERGKYRWQILVKSPDRKALISIIHSLPSGWSYDIDPSNLL
jgi:primosomal protein N' (replication factor Y)